MDVVHSIGKWIDHNRYQFMAIIIFCLVGGWLLCGCVETQSLLNPETKVNDVELQQEIAVIQGTIAEKEAAINQAISNLDAEVDKYNQKIEIAVEDLAKQAEMRQKVLEIAGSLGTAALTGGATASTVLPSVIAFGSLLAAGGTIADNRRKNLIIKQQKDA